jgi:hypothetical protein
VKGTLKASEQVIVIDDSEIIITVTDKKVHVYQSTTYDIDELPEKYHAIVGLIKVTKI